MSTPDFTGPGYFAGEAPDGLTTVAGVPVTAQVRVYWRDPDDPNAAEVLVETTQSSASGSWRIVGVNPELLYLIRGIKAGYNDVSVNDCTPTRTDIIEVTSRDAVPSGLLNAVIGSAFLVGGLPPYTLTVTGLPSDVTLALDADGRSTTLGGEGVLGKWLATVHVVAGGGVATTFYHWSPALVEDWVTADLRFVFGVTSYTPPDSIVFKFGE